MLACELLMIHYLCNLPDWPLNFAEVDRYKRIRECFLERVERSIEGGAADLCDPNIFEARSHEIVRRRKVGILGGIETN